jgi:biotin operon repressor
VKIRVHSSDGVYVGGLFKTDCFNANSCRFWPGRPHPDYAESLIDIAGKSNPCYDSSWFRLQIAAVPDISGPPDGSDDFDANSRAIRITLSEAHQWLTSHGFTPPADLLALLGGSAPPAPAAARAAPAAPQLAPIPESARAVWDALHRTALTAKELAQQLGSSEDAMRKRVDALRELGYDIRNQRGAGYYRPDAPPPSPIGATGVTPESD